jgi:hypothetical protein
MQSFLGPESELTEQQRAFVREAIAEMPKMCATEIPEAQAMARKLEERMAPLFSRQLAFRIFAHLGPLEPPGGIAPPV